MPRAVCPKPGLVDTWGRANRKLTDRKCEACGAGYRPAKASARFCSRPCMWSKNGGANKKPVTWWKNGRGYVEGRLWLADGTQIRIKQHRWIVSGILGRPLELWEDVHHVNGIKDDNRPENLAVLAHGDHSRITNSERDFKRGYKLNLSEAERESRSRRAVAMSLSQIGRDSKAAKKSTAVRAASTEIARMGVDGETDDDGDEFVLENDDAVDGLHSCVRLAREALAGEGAG